VVRLNGDSGCCRPSEALEIRIVSGSPADARARTGENDRGEYTDSIIAGYYFLSWSSLDRPYEDPVWAFDYRSYRGLVGDELLPGIGRMQAFLANFPGFPFAQSIRLRLATQLAIVGRTSEANEEIRKISTTPQEPHVAEDARRLQAALHAALGRDAGPSGAFPTSSGP